MKKPVVKIVISVLLIMVVTTVIVLLCVHGCERTKTDVNTFKSTLESMNYTIDIPDSKSISPDITEIYVANKGDDNIVEYMVFTNDDFAKKFFDNRKETYKNIAGKRTEVETNFSKYSKYAITLKNDRFNYIARIDNTILMALTSGENKKEAEEIIKKLGY